MLKEFYPEIIPFNTFHLAVSDLHNIYVEQAGNPKGKPVIFLHGGPGGGITDNHRRYFNPDKYHIILFDQRGAGKSKPLAEIRENSTWDLISDIEKIREHLKIDTWMVFGGSWGSTLALSYAISHPQKVTELVLRGIFLCRPSEIHWLYQDGASQIYPDVYDIYSTFIPENERKNLLYAYHQRVTSLDREVAIASAKVWSKWEAATSYLYYNQEAVDEFNDPDFAISFARIECHYFVNNAFFPTDNYLLENIDKIKNIPTVIVQGRYDLVCPAKSAWELHKALPKSKLIMVPNAGHSASEPGIRSALIEYTDKWA